MGVIAEKFSDEKGLVWPIGIAPAQVYLVRLGDGDDVVKSADDLYSLLTSNGVEVLYDDRDVRAGEKFADADLMGIPVRIVVSSKTISDGNHEVKERTQDQAKMMDNSAILEYLAGLMADNQQVGISK